MGAPGAAAHRDRSLFLQARPWAVATGVQMWTVCWGQGGPGDSSGRGGALLEDRANEESVGCQRAGPETKPGVSK